MVLRILRGITQADLAAMVSDITGEALTPKAVSAWENGRRSVTPAHIVAISKALDCIPQDLFDDGTRSEIRDRVHAVLSAAGYSAHEREILRHAAVVWGGDVHALIEFIGAYCAMPAELRAEVADYGLYIFRKAEAGGRLSAPYSLDLQFIQRKLDILEEE